MIQQRAQRVDRKYFHHTGDGRQAGSLRVWNLHHQGVVQRFNRAQYFALGGLDPRPGGRLLGADRRALPLRRRAVQQRLTSAPRRRTGYIGTYGFRRKLDDVTVWNNLGTKCRQAKKDDPEAPHRQLLVFL